MNLDIEHHPFTPFLFPDTRVVICGTFPPKREKWAMDFFYPNFYNDMWRIFGQIFYGEKEIFFNREEKKIYKEKIQALLKEKGIGIGETVVEAIRIKDNASDKYLEVVTPVNLPRLMEKIPLCADLVTTGEKAASVIADITGTVIPKIGEWQDCEVKITDGAIRKFRHWRMPSTSRAYPMKMEEKMRYYKTMLEEVGIKID